MLSSLSSPSFMDEKRLSRVTFWNCLNCSSFCSCFLCSTSSRASFSSETASNLSPPVGTSSRPITSTGTDGPASSSFLPRSFVITLTLPTVVPATTMSPVLNVPFCTRSVATGPLPLSSLASITIPFAARFGFALSSSISATRSIDSRSLSMPI